MSIKLGGNIASLGVQRQLALGSNDLSSVMTRLSSGQRINSASDDAAGLAIATDLQAGVRIRSQAIRNVSDGISLLRIAEGALTELTNITTRISELAEQSANGIYSLNQRRALNQEAESLTKEYNRIVATTSFNGRNVFSSENSELYIQAGVGNNAILGIDTLKDLGKAFGDGTMSAGQIFGGVSGAGSASFIDINGDGKLDMASAHFSSGGIQVRIGNGDGSFQDAIITNESGFSGGIFADFNGDGVIDFAGAKEFGGEGMHVRFGNGNGTFQAGTHYNNATIAAERNITSADLNNDGKLDIITYSSAGGMAIYINNGDGTFSTGITNSHTTGGFALGDFNNDGIIDLVKGVGGANVQAFFGNGDGTFAAAQSMNVAGGTQLGSILLVDTNRDGLLDIVASRGGNLSVFLGNGNGTFGSQTSFSSNMTLELVLTTGDFNGDGIIDIAGSAWNQTSIRVMYGNGDGNFTAGTTVSGLVNTFLIQSGDINGDGVDEIISFAQPNGQLQIINPNTVKRANLEYVNLLNQQGARKALDTITQYRDRIAKQLSQIGAFESRLNVARNNLLTEKENYSAAASRIMDSDVATDAAEMIRLQIRQQATVSVLGKVNLIPDLVLRLLS